MCTGVCNRELLTFNNNNNLIINEDDFLIGLRCSSGTINSQGYCINNSTNLWIDTTNLISWHWDFGDMTTLNDTSHLANTSYQYPSAGNYSVQLIVIDN